MLMGIASADFSQRTGPRASCKGFLTQSKIKNLGLQKHKYSCLVVRSVGILSPLKQKILQRQSPL